MLPPFFRKGAIDIREQPCRIAKSRICERVQIVPAEESYLIYYCKTLIREQNPATNRSTIIERFVENPPPKA